uniref:Uncharacterized protein n=1 Tax=Chromera velia CCMP2878 TaxID=1169474 RepID=A0A0G4HX96_9ALVE|eukprot:Cvel_33071.t1-p1 / transcript=Cvel_33071.t1 / gene=Cvel_33071 / organism=Chromera_velia_CCMP2878 / gene_product=hypothetical protein / transcript_product=hypothetical protein / location=Cvel_scaffold5274:855-1667(+) / protein_length=77 / sequence_SO=supercontig / SO=protein_coding / is_pseudo=false
MKKLQKVRNVQETEIKNWTALLLKTDEGTAHRGFAQLREHCINWAARNIMKVRDLPEFDRLKRETMIAIFKALRSPA